MSWSVSAIGKPGAVAGKLAKQFEQVKCQEPEETIKNTVASAVATALAAYDPDTPVKVSASGSQSTDSGKATHTNSLSVAIEPMWGFIE